MTNLVNLTPHPINIYDKTGTDIILTVPPYGYSVRVGSEYTATDVIGITSIITVNGATPVDMPIAIGVKNFDKDDVYLLLNDDIKKRVVNPKRHKMLPQDGSFYIVSSMMKECRDDFIGIGDEIRDEKGNTIGCIGLSV